MEKNMSQESINRMAINHILSVKEQVIVIGEKVKQMRSNQITYRKSINNKINTLKDSIQSEIEEKIEDISNDKNKILGLIKKSSYLIIDNTKNLKISDIGDVPENLEEVENPDRLIIETEEVINDVIKDLYN